MSSLPSPRSRGFAVLCAGLSVAALSVALPGPLRVTAVVLVMLALTAAAVLADRIGIRALGASARLVLAVAATSVGIAVGLGYARKSAPAVPIALGIVALGAGSAVFVLAVRGFWRAVPGWRRLLLVPAGLVGALAVWTVFPAVVAVAPAPTPLGSADPGDRGLSYSTVSVPADGGIHLAAWYVASTNRAAVVLLHGSGSNRSATLGQAVVLARHGFGVLMLDARGHGGSGGRGMDFGWYGERDISAAVTWLRTRSDVDPNRIAAVGLSMGGEEAIGAAGADARLRAVVAEGVTGRSAADKAGWLPHGISGVIQRGMDQVTYGLTGLLTDAPKPDALWRAAARAAPRPILIITAGTMPDEARAANAIRARAPANIRVWGVPKAGHTGGLTTSPAAWESTVIGFLNTALGLA